MLETITADAPTEDRVRSVLEKLCARHHIPGAALAVARGDEVLATVAHGTANRNTGLAVVEDTIFQGGSIGKAYTATMVMQLVDEGRLELDAPVRTYLPALRFADRVATRTVTVRQLLAHTSGLDGDRLDETGSVFGRGDDCLERYVASLDDLPQIATPGRLWSYCNSGYVLLGHLVAVLTGMTYEQALVERIVTPLGLRHTVCFAEEAILRSVAVGHMRRPDGEVMVTPLWGLGRAVGPAGMALLTSVGDLVAFGQMHLRGGLAAGGTRVLSEASVRAMQVPQVECPERELLGDHWGLGWLLRTESGPTVIGHDGNTFGQTAVLRLIPELGVSVGLLANLAGVNFAFREVAEQLLDPWLGTVTPARRRPADIPGLDLDRFAGTYARLGVRHPVDVADGRLRLGVEMAAERAATGETVDSRPRPMLPVDESTFLVHLDEVDEDMQVHFLEPDATGRPEYLHFGGRLSRRVPG